MVDDCCGRVKATAATAGLDSNGNAKLDDDDGSKDAKQDGKDNSMIG